MAQFTVNIVTQPAFKTAGVKVSTTMDKASVDCPKLWQDTFGPRMGNFPADPALPGTSFGVSIMRDSNSFDYWAVMPLAPGADLPDGMERLDIASGLYAEVRLKSLAELGDAYMYVYGQWAKEQKSHALDMNGASYEQYHEDFCETGTLVIYCPLLRK